ncbi:glycoside hydrolase family 5 protein [Vararia minispora EC-137]|uniref:Glycoside hydrolase family 5 protein n=1 Tax=Vararia minispora EC-137 TaxID=1314806 RepID=A0ACB8QW99_9AGAM|nr:glycoside hydrolase family 5 protein [Vararia minispora EC-137]
MPPRFLKEKENVYSPPRAASRRRFFVLAAIAALVLLVAAVIIPVYFTVIRKPSDRSASAGSSSGSSNSSTSGSSGNSNPKSAVAITGGDGSTVTMDNGSTFTYHNSFGGRWYWDANDPFNNGAQPQSWSPALNETFQYGVDRIYGVNLGGWLVTEPLSSVPALYQKYPGTIDEWTLSQAMAADTASGGLNQLEDHYKSFITEQDFAQIAAAGLNYVRIPLGYWAIETRQGEPFLAKTSWNYFLKAINWARKYGIRINLDFHSVPGSQNGWNHSGRLGTISFLNGTMGYANAQRTLDYIRIIAEFISQPQYSSVVTMLGIINEPRAIFISNENVQRFYGEAYSIVRTASGYGAGKGPIVSLHDAFNGLPWWAGWGPGADRLALDYHPYVAFDKPQPVDSITNHVTLPCTRWGNQLNQSMSAFGMTAAGEFSNAITDCGTYVNGVGQGSRYEGNYIYDSSFQRVGSCTPYIQWQNWDATYKKAMMQFAMSSMDALNNWFFWTWKVGNSTMSGTVEAPAWSYQLGLQQGWIPTDPRSALGACGNTDPFTGTLPGSATGSGGTTIDSSFLATIGWPPTTITNAAPVTGLPSYTPTGAVPTLTAASFTPTTSSVTINAGNGWNNPSDNAGFMVPINGCQYNDAWMESAEPTPPACTPARKRDDVPPSLITPAPQR